MATSTTEATTARDPVAEVAARLFPKQFDDDYRGHPAAVWILCLVGSSYLAWASLGLIAGGIETRADGWLLGGLAMLAIVSYRAMIPLISLLMVADDIAGGFPGDVISLAFAGLAAIGLVLSLRAGDEATGWRDRGAQPI